MLRFKKTVRLIRQHAMSECGLACLAMVVTSLGRKTTVSELRGISPVGRDGLGSKRIISIAKTLGVSATVCSTESTDWRDFPWPAMLHWETSHWVVLEHSSARGFHIADPARGKRRISANEFCRRFTGTVIKFETTDQFVSSNRTLSSPSWQLLREALRAERGEALIALMFVASIILQVLGLASPLLVKVAVDTIIPLHVASAVPLVAAAVSILVVARVVSELLRSLCLIRLRSSVDAKATVRVSEHILRLPYSFFQTCSRGDLISRVHGFTSIRLLATMRGVSSTLDALFIIFYIAALLFISAPIGLIISAFVGIQITCLLFASPSLQNRTKIASQSGVEQNAYLSDLIANIEHIKASACEEFGLDHWRALLYSHLSATNRVAYVYCGLSALSAFCNVGAPLAVLLVGLHLAMTGRITTGVMLGAIILVGIMFEPLPNLVKFFEQLQDTRTNVERLDDVLSVRKERGSSPEAAPHVLYDSISVDQITFSYPGSTYPVLKDISFSIRRGETVALVGSTGSGKSTLAKLLIALDEPTEGEISIDGEPLRKLDLAQLRRQIGFAPQNPVLLNATLRENVSFGVPGASLDNVIEVCRLACVHDEITQFPLGYDTLVFNYGSNLSGGQRQRIAIARALLKGPRLLVLDEATSHLDSELEARIEKMIAGLSCTRIVISHRLSTIKNADQILVLQHGRLVENGRHEELLDRNGRYAALVRAQITETAPCLMTVGQSAPREHQQ